MSQRRTVERRKHVRLPVQFRSALRVLEKRITGEGIVHDISVAGCRIESDVTVSFGYNLELRIHLVDQDAPVVIPRAVVRWARDEYFGVEFLEVGQEARTRISHLLKEPDAGKVPDRPVSPEINLPSDSATPEEK